MNFRQQRVNFIGLGVQKAGTTWIHANLDAHPELFVAKGKDKDTAFFSCFYDRGYQWYESHFSAAIDSELAGEVSTSYFYDSDAPGRIRLYNPAVRLFVCLRNPVERVISNHRHEVRYGRISGANLDLGNALENNPAYILQSSYAVHLERWYQYFDPSQICVLFFDDIKSDPAGFMRNLYGFLGVSDEFFAEGVGQEANKSRLPANRGVERTIKQAGGGLRRLGLGKLVSAGRSLGINDWLRKINTVRDESSVVKIPDKVVVQIKDTLRPDIEKLGEMTGRNVSGWLT